MNDFAVVSWYIAIVTMFLAILAIPIAVVAIIIMSGRDHKLVMRRRCRELAEIHMQRGDLEKAREYIDESKKYRLSRSTR